MNKAHIKLLKDSYEDACEKYLQAFCANYEFQYERNAWVANEVGTIANVGDYFFDFDVIKYCVDNDLKDSNELLNWYDHTLNCGHLGLSIPNFESWHKGCPRVSDNKIEKLLAIKYDLEKEIKEITGEYKQVNIF